MPTSPRQREALSLRGAQRRGNPSLFSEGRIPTPVCTPRALAPRRALARNDREGGRRDTWVPPYGYARYTIRRTRPPRRPVSHASRPRRRDGRLCSPVLPAPLALFRRGRRPRRPVSAAAPRCHCEERSDAAIRLSFRKDGFPRQCVPQGHLLRGAHWHGMTERWAAGHMGPALRGRCVEPPAGHAIPAVPLTSPLSSRTGSPPR